MKIPCLVPRPSATFPKYDLKSCVDRYASPGERLPEENIQIITITTGSASNTWQFYTALGLEAC